jgi:anti-sigma regulatory factor (Ser/Thr protein kinase)
MGKGVPAALIGAAVRTTYNQVVSELLASSFGSRELPSPAEVMNALHRQLTPRLIELEAFVTMALYRFDFDYGSGTMRYVNAGHTAGLLVRADGGIERMLGDNVPVGVLTEERYVERAEVVDVGDQLLVYSDGITEARDADGAEFGEERLRDFVTHTRGHRLPASIFLQALRRTVRDFAGERGMPDDQTAVLVSLRPQPFADHAGQGSPCGTEVLDLPWDPTRLDALRARVRAAALPLGADAADGLVLGSFEAATNVIRHVARPFPDATLSLRIIREATGVTVEIWYLGEPFVPPAEVLPDFSGDSEGGFGLYIISQAVRGVTYESPLPGVCCTRLVQTAV